MVHQPVAFGPFRLDQQGRSLTRAGAEVSLGRRAFDVLCVLAAAGGEPVSKDALLDQVWPGLTVEENNLQVQISALRKVLGDGMIVTIPGRGYRLTMAVPGKQSPTPEAATGKPSIAVLPFTNMSGDIEQEYFADGVADDIITELARVRSLLVIARNSSFAYKGQAIDVRQIARELGVRYILEGSVRRSGDRVRIGAQLIDATTADHIWAERYDRGVADIFAVQDEISAAVTGAIGPAILDAERRRAVRKPPTSLNAWEAYYCAASGTTDKEPPLITSRRSNSFNAPSHWIPHSRRRMRPWLGHISTMGRDLARDQWRTQQRCRQTGRARLLPSIPRMRTRGPWSL